MLCSVYSAQPNGLSCPLLQLMGLEAFEISPSPSYVRVRGSEKGSRIRRRRHDVRAHLRPVHAAGDRQGAGDGAPGGAPARAGGVPSPRGRLVPRLTVAQLRSIRASLPPMARLLVTKISDVAAAVAGTRWEALELSVKLTPVLHCIMLKCLVLTLTQRACNLLMIFVYFQTIAMVSL
jgi:hypothetical protein